MRRLVTGALGARLSALIAVLLFGGCAAVGPDFERPEVPWLAGWRSGSLDSLAAEQHGKAKAQLEEWWRNFNDPALVRMVAEAQRVNPDVRTAGMRILEARAQLMIAGSLLYPQQQQVTGSVVRSGGVRLPGRNVAVTVANAGFSLGWEIDFWGKFRRSIESADAGYFASIAQYDDLQVLLAAQVASTYCAIRTIELQLKIAHENAKLQKRSVEITEQLFKHGNESELDVQQAKAEYLATLATIPQFEGSLRQNQNALSVLLARPPGPLPALAEGKKTIPLAELGVIVDLPADLLRRRPDVRAVEMLLAAQSAQIGVAEADFYPSISLLGSLGLSATSLAGSPSTLAYGIGPNLVWNVFDHGRMTGQVLVQDARYQQLYQQYQAAILTAAREIDDAAVGFGTNRAQIPILKDAVKAAQRSLGIANLQYQDGISDFQRVLDAQRTLFSQQEVLVSTISNATLSLIALYKAMGGGWQQGRGRPLVDAATGETMGEPGDWQEILAAPLPPPAAGPQLIRKK